MPSRMEQIAARSAQSPAEYVANKARNDAAVVSWNKAQKSALSKRRTAVDKYGMAQQMGATYTRRTSASGEILSEEGVKVQHMVLQSVPAPVEVDEPPADLVDYSLSPIDMEPPWEQMPAGGSISAVTPILGTMLIYLGKRLIISMAMAGAAEAGKFAMQQLGTYTKNARDAHVRFHTGRSPRGRVKLIEPLRYEGPMQDGSGAFDPGASLLESIWDGMQFSWGKVKEQWKDPASFFYWLR